MSYAELHKNTNMDGFIMLANGEPATHPIIYQNFVECFPHIDVNNLPENVGYFKHFPPNFTVNFNQITSYTYAFDSANNYWYHNWSVRDMTDDEHAEKLKIKYTLKLNHHKNKLHEANNHIANTDPYYLENRIEVYTKYKNRIIKFNDKLEKLLNNTQISNTEFCKIDFDNLPWPFDPVFHPNYGYIETGHWKYQYSIAGNGHDQPLWVTPPEHPTSPFTPQIVRTAANTA
jgi:hypothetical protein